jgi:hypothetical protein
MSDAYNCKCGAELFNIVEIIEHLSECSPVRLTVQSLTRKEKNTLLYIEDRVVDNGGKLAAVQMNYEDQQNIKLFEAAGLLEVGEPRPDPDDPVREDAQIVEKFTDEAWDLVRDCRQLRAHRDKRVDFPVGMNDE